MASRPRFVVLAAALSVALPLSPLYAGNAGSITDGQMTFTRAGFGTNPGASLVHAGVNAAWDYLYAMGWWIRVSDGTQEDPFPEPTTALFNGDRSTITWDRVAGSGPTDWLSATESITVVDYSTELGHAGGYLLIELTLQNLIDAPYSVYLFHYADIDIVDINADDSAKLVERTPNHLIEVSEGSAFAQYVGAQEGYVALNKIHHRGGDYLAVVDALNDTAETNFTDTGLPFGPGDFGGAYEFEQLIQPAGQQGDSFEVVLLLAVNMTVNCSYPWGVYCDGFEGGNPSLWVVSP